MFTRCIGAIDRALTRNWGRIYEHNNVIGVYRCLGIQLRRLPELYTRYAYESVVSLWKGFVFQNSILFLCCVIGP